MVCWSILLFATMILFWPSTSARISAEVGSATLLSRRIVKIETEHIAAADKLMRTLMGSNVESRKNYIIEHSDIGTLDNLIL